MLVWPVRARETAGTRPTSPAREPEPHVEVPVSSANSSRHPERYPLDRLLVRAPGSTARQIAEGAGFTKRSAVRWATAGLTDIVADRVATSLGLHPAEVWGDAWLAGTAS